MRSVNRDAIKKRIPLESRPSLDLMAWPVHQGAAAMRRKREDLNVVLGYRSYAGTPGISHAGLGVSSINTAKTLTAHGIKARTHGFVYPKDFYHFLKAHPETTHLIIAAPWVKTHELAGITSVYPDVQVSVVSHSNISFLGADYGALILLREQMCLEMERSNFRVASNNVRLKNFFESTYDAPCTLLNNLYYLHPEIRPVSRPTWFQSHGVLRVGCFGATRQQKNIPTAVAAAVQIGRELNAEVECLISSSRNDDPLSRTIRRTCKEIAQGTPNVRLIESGWLSWAPFRQLVSGRHILLSPSSTETFSVVTADGVACGVPSVCGPATEWVPPEWMADIDDVNDVARKGIGLLADPRAAARGREALESYVKDGLRNWERYLLA